MAGLSTKNPSSKKKAPETLQLESYLSLVFFFLSLFTAFSLFSYDDGEYGSQNNLFGRIGHFFSWLFFFFLGRSAFQIPFFLFGFGILFFQKKDANLKNIFYGLGIVLVSGAVFGNLFERDISSLKHGGGKFGTWVSELLEYFVGKSGRVLISLAGYIFGFLLIAKEFPRKIDSEFWIKGYSKFKEKLLELITPAPATASEIQDGTKDVPIKDYDLPWIEIKKVPKDWKFATSRTFLSETNYKISTVTELEEESSPPSSNILEKTKQFFEAVKSSRSISNLLRKKEESVSTAPTPQQETANIEVEEPQIEFPETPKTLKEKIYGAPLPSTEALEALNLSEEVSSTKEKTALETFSEEEQVTAEELEMLFANDSSDASEASQSTTVSEAVVSGDVISTGPSNFDELTKISEQEELRKQQESLTHQEEEEKSSRTILFKSTVPSINFLRKTQYKISHKHLATNLEKKPNPMFRLEAEYTARKIEEIIKEYGYESKVTTWQKGPIITRYEVAPPSGVKLGKITSLSDELKLYLAVKSIRIVAPIPGKSTIGIEVPNKFREQVLLGDILREKPESIPAGDLLITLGKDSISGETVYIDLNKLPHLLIAGTTGSGKSVSLNSMISYLIMTKSPTEVRFVMIDPKMVEMSLYENIPHLLMPVITDPRKATKALYWAVQEMESRYAMISEIKCRDIKAYNEKVNNSLLAHMQYAPMPYIVIFIDELSDLMMVAGKELEDSITRLSQKARAVGIHLVMATQRPSVDVITGLIKANCPARLAFHVAQKNDSKIILDYSGADTLLGKGDSLYKSPTSPDLQRIQAPFISEEEIEKIVEEAISYARPSYVDVNLEEEVYKEELSDADEAEFEEAWNIVRTERKASASYLQRRMRIGYNKAARLMEMMEERGYVGPQIGSKPREILR